MKLKKRNVQREKYVEVCEMQNVFVANSVDPDQTAIQRAVWSRSTMFVCTEILAIDVILDVLYVDIVPYMFC